MYHRFVIKDYKPRPESQGLISYSVSVWKNDTYTKDKELNDLILWYNHYLPAPKNPDGIFWFKDGMSLEKTFLLANLVQSRYTDVYYFVAEDPGKITYEDNQQVAARYHRRVKAKLRRLT